MERYLEELSNCRMCEWQCGVNRLEGGRGFCGITIPRVASSMLHPAPPASYDAFLVGCSFRCIFCQNWSISNYPDNPFSRDIEGYYPPKEWAIKALDSLKSSRARLIGADRMFFTGGEPTCSLPWVEEVVKEAKKIDPTVKVNFDTNGFMTMKSLSRILNFTTSLTFDIKAYNEKVHQALTGAPVEPVLRNAEYIGRRAKEKIWEFRIMIIPKIHERQEIESLCEFIADIDPSIPVCFLAFRPNFAMDSYRGPSTSLMQECIEIAKKEGLTNVHWSGCAGIGGETLNVEGVDLALYYAKKGGCQKSRKCGKCPDCKLKRYVPFRST